MLKPSLFIFRLLPKHLADLSKIFSAISCDPTARNFHPHSFTVEYAKNIVAYQGRDLYLGAFDTSGMIGYGMLRGWDAGYEVPSLGIYLVPTSRGRGLSKTFMSEMHSHAFENGALRIRLKVYSTNVAARRLYEQLGYIFEPEEAGQLVGYLNLG